MNKISSIAIFKDLFYLKFSVKEGGREGRKKEEEEEGWVIQGEQLKDHSNLHDTFLKCMLLIFAVPFFIALFNSMKIWGGTQ